MFAAAVSSGAHGVSASGGRRMTAEPASIAYEPPAPRPPLTFAEKASFASGDIVDGTVNFGIGVFIFYYLTAVCGLSGTVAGALLAVSTLCDAIVDPMIGSISDNPRSRY